MQNDANDIPEILDDPQKLSPGLLEELEQVLKKCSITISNYVLVVNIKMDKEASVHDPRICREEACTYVPEPFASYLSSIEHVRKPTSTKVSHPTEGPRSFGDDYCYYDTGKIEDDPWVFAMLCGLKSVGDKSRQKMTKAVIKQLKTGGIIEQDELPDEDSRRSPMGTDEPMYPDFGERDVRMTQSWTDDIVRSRNAQQAITLADKNFGQERYSESPVDRFQLSDLVHRFRDYNAKCITPKFAAVILRSYLASFSVFSPGKGVCTGSRTDLVGQYVIMKNILLLRKLGFPRARLLSKPLTPQNVVATFFLPFRINIELLRQKYHKYCTRTVTIFPGATVRFPEISPAAQLVFNSGKIVTMGGKSPSDHIRALIYTLHRYWLVREEESSEPKELTLHDFRDPSSSAMQEKCSIANKRKRKRKCKPKPKQTLDTPELPERQESMEIFPLGRVDSKRFSISESDGTKHKQF